MKSKNKIAFVTKNWLGDILMQTPAIHALRKNFPEAEIIGFVPERCHEVLKNNPDIDRLVPFHEKENLRGIFRQMAFVRATRENHIDRVYLFHRSFSRALLFALSGIDQRIGYATKARDWLLTDAVPEPLGPRHQSDYFLELLRKSGLRVLDGVHSTRFYPSAEDRAGAYELINAHGISRDNYIVVHAGANWAPKRWPPQFHGELSDYLHQRYGAHVVFSGGPDDSVLAQLILLAVKKAKTFDVTGQTNFGTLAALFEGARLVISGDSGPMHLAASVGAPLLALFLATDSALTGPRGSGPTVVVQKKEAIRAPSLHVEHSERIYKVDKINPASVAQIIEKTVLLETAGARHSHE